MLKMSIKGKLGGGLGNIARSLLFLALAFSNAQAASTSVIVNLTGMDATSIKNASDAVVTSSTTLSIGWFNSQTPVNWSLVTRANLQNYFTSVGSIQNYTQGYYSYGFSGTVPSNGDLKAYLVISSGSSDLGIFSWNTTAGNSPTFFEGAEEGVPFPMSVDTSVVPEFAWWTLLQANLGFVSGTNAAPVLKLASASGSVASPQSITFGAIPSKSKGDAFTLSATGGGSGLPVTYESLDPSVATVNGSTVNVVGTGTARIKASQAGNTSYSAATDVTQSFAAYASTTLRLTTLGTPLLSGGQTSVKHAFVGNPNSTYTIEYKSDLSASTWSTLTATTDVNGIFEATFTATGDIVNAWKNRMFFRAKNS
jgi:hypothetical protein